MGKQRGGRISPVGGRGRGYGSDTGFEDLETGKDIYVAEDGKSARKRLIQGDGSINVQG